MPKTRPSHTPNSICSIPAPPNFPLRHPKYHLLETMLPLIAVHSVVLEVEGQTSGTSGLDQGAELCAHSLPWAWWAGLSTKLAEGTPRPLCIYMYIHMYLICVYIYVRICMHVFMKLSAHKSVQDYVSAYACSCLSIHSHST